MLAIILPLSMTGSLLAGILNLRWGRTLPVVLATVAATASLLALVQSQAPIFFALAFLMHQIAWNFGIGYVYGAVSKISDGSGAEILAPGSQSVGTRARSNSRRHTSSQSFDGRGDLGINFGHDYGLNYFIFYASRSLTPQLTKRVCTLVWHLLNFNHISKWIFAVGHQIAITCVDWVRVPLDTMCFERLKRDLHIVHLK